MCVIIIIIILVLATPSHYQKNNRDKNKNERCREVITKISHYYHKYICNCLKTAIYL